MKVSLAAQVMSSNQLSAPLGKDIYCVKLNHIILSAIVLCVAMGCFMLFPFISRSTLNGMCIILTLIACKFRKHVSVDNCVCQGG